MEWVELFKKLNKHYANAYIDERYRDTSDKEGLKLYDEISAMINPLGLILIHETYFDYYWAIGVE